jgi:hypothetical protein
VTLQRKNRPSKFLPRKTICSSAEISSYIPILACIFASVLLLALTDPLPAQQPDPTEKKQKSRNLSWNPPKVDSPIRTASSSPSCDLANVLRQTGARTSELVTNLQNFTAQEKIAFESVDRQGFVRDTGSETFEYVVIFHQDETQPVVEESRNPTHGSTLPGVTSWSRGLPEMVLLFLPAVQDDYEMKCEGAADWQGQHTWVVHFQQRADKPGRTFSFRYAGAVYPASLKGHAWIAANSGEVVHLETGLMEPIATVQVHQWYLSIDYAPVQFRTHDVKIWLPESADAYYDFGIYREIISHTFKDFLLFSVDSQQKIDKPKQP